jgi:excinuclease ABC subunit C
MIAISSPTEFKSAKIPTFPGVYFFKDEKNDIIYIGKAKNLRSRVKSYFSASEKPTKIKNLLSNIRSIDWIIVDNELEALLLENKLVKQHMPKYNINLKDAKTFAYIAFSRETIPRVLTSRKVSRKLESFGPYTDGFTRQDLTRLVVRVFKLRTCKKLSKRPCLNFYIGLCTAPCANKVTDGQYQEQIEKARQFLQGKYEQTAKMLAQEMQNASTNQKYERALELRNQIASIKLLTKRQVVDTEKGFDQDVMVFRRIGQEVKIVQMGIRKGVLLGKKEFSLDLQPNVEQEFLKAFYFSNQIPREVLLNQQCWSDSQEKDALERFFSKERGACVTLSVPKRGNRIALVNIAQKNIEANLSSNSALIDIQTELNLPTIPRIIECFDVSNLGTEHLVSGMVRFTDGKPDKCNYRRFKIKTVVGQDDVASINEVVTRRYKRLSSNGTKMPDLIIIDGGPGQLNSAKRALQSLGLQTPIIGLAKKNEEIFLPGETEPRRFDNNNRMMLIIRQIRDVTHNFALGYNKKRREMKMKSDFA